MTIHYDDECIKTVLLAMAKELEIGSVPYSKTDNRTVRRCALNMLLVAEKLKTLANSRAVEILWNHME